MSTTNAALTIFTILLLAYAIYDEFIMGKLKGKTQLHVNLQRRKKIDSIIFITLIIILSYKNSKDQSTITTHYLLIGLALITFYISFIRWPKLLFKKTGFFYANSFITYDRVKSINLSEDGILLMGLENKKLLIKVNKYDDLQNIYNLLIEVE